MCVGFQNWNPYKMPNSVEGSQEMVKEKINNDLKRTDSVSTSICYPKLSEWKSLSRVQLFATHGLYMVAYPFPADLPDPGIKLGSPTLWVNSLPVELPGKHYPKLNGIEILKWVSGNQGYRFIVKGCFSPCLSLVVRQCMPPASPAQEWHDPRHHMKEKFSIHLADMVLVLYSHFPGHRTQFFSASDDLNN